MIPPAIFKNSKYTVNITVLFLFNSTFMDLTSELLLKFPATQISTVKNFKKSRITIHPQAYGFNLMLLKYVEKSRSRFRYF